MGRLLDAHELPERAPAGPENLREVRRLSGGRRKRFGPIRGPVVAIPIAVSPEIGIRPLGRDPEHEGDVPGDLAIGVHDDVLEDDSHRRPAAKVSECLVR